MAIVLIITLLVGSTVFLNPMQLEPYMIIGAYAIGALTGVVFVGMHKIFDRR